MPAQDVRTPEEDKKKIEQPPNKAKKAKRKTKKKAKPKALAFPIETSELMRETLALEAGERQTMFARVLAHIRDFLRPPAAPGNDLPPS